MHSAGAKGRDVEGIIQTFAQRAPPVVPRFSPQESWRGALGEAAEAVKRSLKARWQVVFCLDGVVHDYSIWSYGCVVETPLSLNIPR